MTLLTTAFAQGTHAARPAASASNNGFYYYETDTQTLFQSTGSAWTQIAASAAGGGGSSPLTTKGDLFGHSTVDARVPVGSDGQVLVADSAQTLGLKWASAGLAKVYAAKLAVDASTIDTGASAIPAGYGVLEIWLLLRTDDAAAAQNALLTLNGDTAANYDVQGVTSNASSTPTASNALAQSNIAILVHGAGGSANYPSVARVTIPFYDQTTFYKVCEFTQGVEDGTAANNWYGAKTFTWRSTAAINQITLTAQSGQKFKAGSQILILGTPQ